MSNNELDLNGKKIIQVFPEYGDAFFMESLESEEEMDYLLDEHSIYIDSVQDANPAFDNDGSYVIRNVSFGNDILAVAFKTDSEAGFDLLLKEYFPGCRAVHGVTLTGREIKPGELTVQQSWGSSVNDSFQWMDELSGYEARFQVALHINCNADEILGTHVETDENDDYVSLYIDFLPSVMDVSDTLSVTLAKGDGTDVEMERRLNRNEQQALRVAVLSAYQKMVSAELRKANAELHKNGGNA